MTGAPGTYAGTYAPPAGTMGTLDGIIEEVKNFFKRHYDNLKGNAELGDKLKFLIKDGYVWMLGVAIYLLFTVYKQQRANRRVLNGNGSN